MSRIVFSPAAEADIDEIWDYTADNWGVGQADHYVAQIRRASAALSPDGREGRAIAHIREGYRKLVVGSHFVVFRLADGNIDVVRILHQRMDISSHLQD